MILTCPECATRYQTDATSFAPGGRKVRCAKCGHVWHQAAPEPEPGAEDEPPLVAPAAASPAAKRANYVPPPSYSPASKPAPRRWLDHLGIMAGWLALAGIIFVIGWSALRFRQDIATMWPQSSSFYSVLGMPVNTKGIDFKDKNAHFETDNGQDVLVITGDLANVTSHEISVPPIRVSLTDDNKRELYHWSFAAPAETLKPGQTEAFKTELPSPPAAARHIELSLGERDH